MAESSTLPVNDEIELMPRASQIVRAPVQDVMLTAAFDIETAQKRLAELQRFVEFYMVEGEDYGKIPGTPKPTLYKSGADKLCDIYALADKYRVTNRTEDWDRNLFDYEVECTLVSKRTDQLVSTGLGSCNSYEGKYRWRESKRKCPQCGKETIIKGKEEYGGGWLCWRKEGKSEGCGAKFLIADPSIVDQMVGKTENEDIPTLKNTILKMAKKRAKMDAVLSATRSSGLFTQDLEDTKVPEDAPEETAKPAPPAKQAAPAKESPQEDLNVVLAPGKEGFRTITGNGLAFLLSNKGLLETEKTVLGLTYDGKFWTVPIAQAFRFVDACVKHGVGAVHMDSSAPKAAQHSRTEDAAQGHSGTNGGGAQPSSASPSRIIKGVFAKSGQYGPKSPRKGQKWELRQVIWGDSRYVAWDKDWWPLLEAGKGKPAIFDVTEPTEKGKDGLINEILRIGDIEYEQIEGKTVPVIQRD